jgi:hypothetical protein
METPCRCDKCLRRTTVPKPALDLKATVRSRKVSFKEMMTQKWINHHDPVPADPEGDAIIAMWQRRLRRGT